MIHMEKHKPSVEDAAVDVARRAWRRLVGCRGGPEDVDKVNEGSGFDLRCRCDRRHIEIKGAVRSSVPFVYLQKKEHDASRRDRKFELWVITGALSDKPVIHVIPRGRVVELTDLYVQWSLSWDKKRLADFRRVVLLFRDILIGGRFKGRKNIKLWICNCGPLPRPLARHREIPRPTVFPRT